LHEHRHGRGGGERAVFVGRGGRDRVVVIAIGVVCMTLDGLPLTTSIVSPQLIVQLEIVSVPGSLDDKFSV
jgi:hypothetical protein